MHKVYSNIFSILEKYKYCVLRNPEGLPFENRSNDIDLLIDKKDFDSAFSEIIISLKDFGYERVEESDFYGIKCYTFYSSIETLEPVKLDFFFQFCGGGLEYISFEDLYQNSVLNSNNIRVLEPNFEHFLNALKTFLSGGSLKAKYAEGLKGAEVEKYITQFNYLGSVLEDIQISKDINNKIQGDRKLYFKEILKSNVKKIGIFNTLINMSSHISKEVRRISTKNRFVVICGIDGSGKTTLIEECFSDTVNQYKSIKDRFIFEHHRPRKVPHLSDLFVLKKKSQAERIQTLENPRTGKVAGKFVSSIKFLYYLLDYSLMFRIKHFNQFRRDKIVIYDRYYFDFLIDPQRSALDISPSLVKMAYKIFVPKPSHAIYVTVPPDIAFKRKGELSIEDSKTLQAKYLEHSDFWCANTEVENIDFSESKKRFKDTFIFGITKDIGEYIV